MSRANEIIQNVQRGYGTVANSGLSSKNEGVAAVARAFGYTVEELSSIPAEANMGLSCGNPTAMAGLKPGETVVDLGCGGGLDVFLAAQKVGLAGQAIGIDMTPEMIRLARDNALRGPAGRPFPNVQFHLAAIDKLPLPAASVDCVISNCVLNLAPDKKAVFREIFRILKPGGRVAVSDIALKKPLPEELAKNVSAWIGCLAGAILIEEYQREMRAAGFQYVEVIDSGADLNAYGAAGKQTACCSPAMDAPASARPSDSLNVLPAGCCSTKPTLSRDFHAELAALIQRYDLNEYAAGVKVFAVRPDGEV